MSLIRAYGEFWDPEQVDWSRRALDGYLRETETNAWEQRGLYVLWGDWRVVYVGRATRQSLGARLLLHRRWRLAGRWDRFSWYGFRKVLKNGDLAQIGTLKAPPEVVIATIEALLIAVTPGSLNRTHESIPGAELVRQLRNEEGVPVQARLDDLQASVDGMRASLDALAESVKGSATRTAASSRRRKQQ